MFEQDLQKLMQVLSLEQTVYPVAPTSPPVCSGATDASSDSPNIGATLVAHIGTIPECEGSRGGWEMI